MPSSKNKLIYIIVPVLLIIAVIVATFLILDPLDSKTDKITPPTVQNQIIDKKKQADSLKAQAAKSTQDNQPDQAKKLYQEAKQIYQDINNTDGVADVDAKLYLIDHPAVVLTPASTTSTLGGAKKYQ